MTVHRPMGWLRVLLLAVPLSVSLPLPASTVGAEGPPDGPSDAVELPAETPDEFFAAGFLKHMAGELGEAIAFYQQSIARKPTAPGHTFLG